MAPCCIPGPHPPTGAGKVPYNREQIVCIFKSLDMNGDGKLSKEEVKKAFAKLGSSWPDFRAWRGQIHADADNDGFISLDKELNQLVNYTLKQQYIYPQTQ